MDVTLDEVIEHAARAAHEVNKVWCELLDDHTQPSWDGANDEIKDSARRGVLAVIDGAGPEESHKAWMREKIRNGWVHGPVKSAVHRKHPCLVPYEELPPEQRAKDMLFVNVVRTFVVAAEAG